MSGPETTAAQLDTAEQILHRLRLELERFETAARRMADVAGYAAKNLAELKPKDRADEGERS